MLFKLNQISRNNRHTTNLGTHASMDTACLSETPAFRELEILVVPPTEEDERLEDKIIEEPRVIEKPKLIVSRETIKPIARDEMTLKEILPLVGVPSRNDVPIEAPCRNVAEIKSSVSPYIKTNHKITLQVFKVSEIAFIDDRHKSKELKETLLKTNL